MGKISSKTLVEDSELDDLLEEDELVEGETLEEEEEEEEEFIPKSKKKRIKLQKNKPKSFSVTLTGATTYYKDGMLFKRNETQELPLSKLSDFKSNGWFTIRY